MAECIFCWECWHSNQITSLVGLCVRQHYAPQNHIVVPRQFSNSMKFHVTTRLSKWWNTVSQHGRPLSFFLSVLLWSLFFCRDTVRKNYSASLFRFSTHPHKCHVTYFTFHCFTFFIQSQWYQIFQSLNESQHHENFLFFVNSNQSTWCHWT